MQAGRSTVTQLGKGDLWKSKQGSSCLGDLSKVSTQTQPLGSPVVKRKHSPENRWWSPGSAI